MYKNESNEQFGSRMNEEIQWNMTPFSRKLRQIKNEIREIKRIMNWNSTFETNVMNVKYWGEDEWGNTMKKEEFIEGITKS